MNYHYFCYADHDLYRVLNWVPHDSLGDHSLIVSMETGSP